MTAEKEYLEQLRARHQQSTSGREAPFPQAPNLDTSFAKANTPRNTPLPSPARYGVPREPVTAATAAEGQTQTIRADALSPSFRQAQAAKEPLQAPKLSQTPRTTSFAKAPDANRPVPVSLPRTALGSLMVKNQRPSPVLKPKTPTARAVDRAAFNKAWGREMGTTQRNQANLNAALAQLKIQESQQQKEDHSAKISRGRGR